MVYFPFYLFEKICAPGLWILTFISHNFLEVSVNRWETFWCPLLSIRRNGRWWIPRKLSLKRKSTIGYYRTWIISPFPWINCSLFLENLRKQSTSCFFSQKVVVMVHSNMSKIRSKWQIYWYFSINFSKYKFLKIGPSIRTSDSLFFYIRKKRVAMVQHQLNSN
jgi:hypothetical protein